MSIPSLQRSPGYLSLQTGGHEADSDANLSHVGDFCAVMPGKVSSSSRLCSTRAELPAPAGSRHSEPWEFGSSPSCCPTDTCSGSRRESSHCHGILELLRAPRKGLPTPPKLLHLQQPHGLVCIPARRVRHGRRKRQRIGVCPMGQAGDAKEKPSKAQQAAAQASSQPRASVSPSME